MSADESPKLEKAAPRSGARRRLLRGGLATGPVLMTIASRPVLGQVCTMSASLSVIPATSVNHTHFCEAPAGLSPERWKQMAGEWPEPYLAVIEQAPVQAPGTPTDASCTPTTVEVVAPVTDGRVARRRTSTDTLTGLRSTTPLPTATTTTTTQVPCTTAPAPAPVVTSGTSYRDAYRARMYSYLTGRTAGTTAQTTTSPTYTAPQTTYSAPQTTSTTTTSQSYTGTSRTYGPASTYTTTAMRRGTTTTVTPTTSTGGTTPIATSPTTTVGPAGTNPQGTLFHSPTTGLNGQVFGTQTMLQALDASGGTYGALGRYIVAALLNARSGRVHVFPESAARSVWNDCVTLGYYEPLAGVRWTPADCVAYIQKTIA